MPVSPGDNRPSVKVTLALPARRASIAQVMSVIALVALNLALVRSVPADVLGYPTIWVFLALIDFVIFWKPILRRLFRAFHYTFFFSFVVVYIVMANAVAIERIHLLSHLVRWYQHVSEANAISISPGFLHIGEVWMACALSFALAIGIGIVAAWLERRLDWDIAAFWRVAFLGLGVFTVVSIAFELVWGGGELSSSQRIVNLLLMTICTLLGGRMGLSRLRSRPLPETIVDQTP
jgi:hypothetical protein